MWHLGCSLFLLLFSLPAFATPGTFVYQGQITKTSGSPLAGNPTTFLVQVLSPTNDCVLYEESHTLNMASSMGVFSLAIGNGTRSGVSFEDTSVLMDVFNNSIGNMTSLTCAIGNSYNPSATDRRKIRLTYNDGSGDVTVATDHQVQSIPYSWQAYTLRGLAPSHFLQTNPALNVTQSNLEALFTGGSYVNLASLVSGSSTAYVQAGTSGAGMPSFAADPGTPTVGSVWFNTTDEALKFFDGTTVQTVGVGTATQVSAGAGTDAAPSMSFSGDPDTGWFNPAANTLAATTNGTEKVRITATGNVGIGTTSPAQALDVEGIINSGYEYRLRNASYTRIAIADTGGGWFGGYNIRGNAQPAGAMLRDSLGTNAAVRFDSTGVRFFTDTSGAAGTTPSERLRIDNDGNIGIGTTAPAVSLDLNTRTDALRIPAGTTAEQPAGADGMFRYNTTLNKFEVYENGAWVNMRDPASNITVTAATGSVGAPSLSFTGEADTGFYSSGLNSVGVSAGGAQIFDFNTVGLVSPTTGGANVLSGNGTEATPTYGFSGDTDTGWFRPAADTMAASTGGTEKVRITSAGNVGINTTNAGHALDVAGTIRGRTALIGNDNGSGYLRGTAIGVTTPVFTFVGETTKGVSNPGANLLGFVTDSSERMRIDGSGNLGVGSTAPTEKVDVVGNIKTSGQLILPATGTAGANSINFGTAGVGISGTGSAITFATANNNRMTIDSSGNINFKNVMTVGAGDNSAQPIASLTGWTNQSVPALQVQAGSGQTGALSQWRNSSGTPLVTMDVGGNIGIGSTSPSRPLTISTTSSNGQIKLSNDTNNPAHWLELAEGGNSPFLRSYYDSNEVMRLYYAGGGAGDGVRAMRFEYGTRNASVSDPTYPATMLFAPRGLATTTPTLFLSASGSVGVGTTASTAKLQTEINNVAGDNLYVGGTRQFSNAIRMKAGAGSGDWAFRMREAAEGDFSVYDVTNSASRMYINAAGNVGIGTTVPGYKLDVQGGDINASGSVRAAGVALTSDIRYKRDIEPIDQALEKLLSLRGVSYNWRASEFPQKHFSSRSQLGVIAQEVEEQFPEVVDTNKDGFKAVNYAALVAPIIEAMKTLYNRSVKLESTQMDHSLQMAAVKNEKADKTETQALRTELQNKEQRIKELELRLERLEKSFNSK